ncbi:apolipoprotein N-acyltransferase [Paralimibaculum aggregatum]|uniref:Apolipoprotein N-acyltransferase n=1 Tax=Paralimibaculum aggregatum TaxID=3036245 RepID=A0ABQ6LLS2_9RHOB|nr:apolipoprotein N-acyltransferase [Limibaculum sp. NKW23]GMG82183.1 apolipoprotein N-acyltransferase [Limibaculum sp. NKW23]
MTGAAADHIAPPPGGGAGAGPAAWMARRGRVLRALMAIAAGAAITLGQPPISLPLALFVALPALVWLTDAAPTPRAAFLTGWCAGFGMLLTGLHWIGHSFLVDAERFLWMLPFAITLLPAALGLFWGAAFWLARRLWPAGHWSRALLLAAAIAAAETARATLFTGLPWGLPGYAWVETPVMQAAAWAGPFGMTLLTLVLAALPGVAGPRRIAGWAALVALGALWAGGMTRLAAPVPPAGPPGPVLRIVQPNAVQHLKWKAGHREIFAARLRAHSGAAPGPLGPPAAVIWPETAITFLPQDAPAAVAGIAASAGGAPLITGAMFYDWTESGERRWSNSLMMVTPQGAIAARYDKHHLVPWGEYVPFRWLLERLGLDAIAGMGGAGFVPGPGPRVLDLPGLPAFAPAICYEMIFADGIVPEGPRPGWILHLTNDAWFGSFAGPQQHLAQARIRAIEQGLPVVRAANTGISAVIDPHGRVLASLPLGTDGYLDARLPQPAPPTLYARTGDAPALLLLSLIWCGFAGWRLTRR